LKLYHQNQELLLHCLKSIILTIQSDLQDQQKKEDTMSNLPQ
jgi:hypothetical protein